MRNKSHILLIVALSLLLFRCGDSPTSSQASGRLVIEATFQSTPQLQKRLTSTDSSGFKLGQSSVKLTRINVRIMEADSSVIEQSDLERRSDGSFIGTLEVVAGKNRTVELTAFFNTVLIARGDTTGVDILPGQTTDVEIDLLFTPGLERNLTILSGRSQIGKIGSNLPEDIVAEITDVNGVGVPGVAVLFEVVEGLGFFAPEFDSLVVTDSSGMARANLKLGDLQGALRVRVSAEDRTGDPLVGSPAFVAATVLPPSPVIDRVEPPLAIKGLSVSVIGGYFDFPPVTVNFGGVPAEVVTIASDTMLTVTVPPAAQTGPVMVETAGGVAVSPEEYSIVKIDRIDLPGLPTGISANLDGSRVYVGNLTAESVEVISTTAKAILTSIPLGDLSLASRLAFPGEMAVGFVLRMGERLFVATTRGVGFVEIEAITNTPINVQYIDTSRVAEARDIAFTPDGSRIFLSSNDYVYSVTTSTSQFSRDSLAGSHDSNGLAVNQAGNRLFATKMKSNQALVFDTQFNRLLGRTIVGDKPVQIAISPDDSLVYVTNSNSNTVSVLRADALTPDGSLIAVATIPVGSSPHGLAITTDNRYVFVANNGENTVSVIEVATLSVISILPCDNNPINVAVLPVGSAIYVTSQKDRSIIIYSLD